MFQDFAEILWGFTKKFHKFSIKWNFQKGNVLEFLPEWGENQRCIYFLLRPRSCSRWHIFGDPKELLNFLVRFYNLMLAVSSLAGSDAYKSFDSNVDRAKGYVNSFSSCPPPVVLNILQWLAISWPIPPFGTVLLYCLPFVPNLFYAFAFGQQSTHLFFQCVVPHFVLDILG